MIQPIILAAGRGTRMGGDSPKTLFPVAGRPMLAYILDALEAAKNCAKPIVVVGHKGDEVNAFVGNRALCVEQTDLTGTASAVKVALPHTPSDISKIYIVYGDHPFVSAGSMKSIEKAHSASGATLTLATATVESFTSWYSIFTSFGRVVRTTEGNVEKIVEYKNATDEEKNILEVNPGFYLADKEWLREALSKIVPNELTGEYYLTDIVALALNQNKHIETISIPPEEALGINSPADAAEAEHILAPDAL